MMACCQRDSSLELLLGEVSKDQLEPYCGDDARLLEIKKQVEVRQGLWQIVAFHEGSKRVDFGTLEGTVFDRERGR